MDYDLGNSASTIESHVLRSFFTKSNDGDDARGPRSALDLHASHFPRNRKHRPTDQLLLVDDKIFVYIRKSESIRMSQFS